MCGERTLQADEDAGGYAVTGHLRLLRRAVTAVENWPHTARCSPGAMPPAAQVVGTVAASSDGLPVTGDQPGRFQPVKRRVDLADGQI